MIKRRKTRTVTVGNLKIGSDYPVVVQSMTKTDTRDIDATTHQIHELETAGCELVRIAIRHMEEAKAISSIKHNINIPLVADIHFDYKLALESIKQGADKIRINPGNITKEEHIYSIIDFASMKGVPVRLGMNSGSLANAGAYGPNPAEVMVNSLLKYLEHFNRRNFHDIIISLKSSDVASTIQAYRKMAAKCDYPFHLGLTAAGPPAEGIVKSSIGIGMLLMDGIGDTIRVSLTGNSAVEVETARRILAGTGIRYFGPEIISCPTCGRCQVNLISIVSELEEKLIRNTKHGMRHTPLTIAVMGCEVNGPGEAKNADVGIAFGQGKGVIFRKGVIVETVDAACAVERLLDLIKQCK